MKTRQSEWRAIPQFDAGRWKLRLERVPVDPDNETTIGMAFDSAREPGLTRPMGHIGSCYDRARQTRNLNILSNESETREIGEQAQQVEAGTRSVTELINDHV